MIISNSHPDNSDQFRARLGIVLTADRIFGSALTLQDCIKVLTRFRLSGVIERTVFLLHVNARIFMDGDTPDEIRRKHESAFFQFMFDHKHGERARKEVAEHTSSFRPLSDQALLATLELALTVCPLDQGATFESEADRLAFTHVILSFQTDLFSSTVVQKLKSGDFTQLSEVDYGEFVRNFAAHNTRAYYRHAMARLFAFCCHQDIGSLVTERMKVSLDEWFHEHFGISAQAYFSLAFVLTAPAHRLIEEQPDANDLYFQPDAFFKSVREPEQSKLLSLVNLSAQSVSEFSANGSLQSSLSDFLYRATNFFVRPILAAGANAVCVSPTLLMNKFLTGLPYLAQESRARILNRKLTDSEVKAARAPLGHLFESYVVWLMRKWLGSWNRTEVISSYYSSPNKSTASECDLVIVRRDAAFAFEIKASVASLKLRHTGAFEDIDRMVKVGASQVHKAAQALLAGKAIRPNGTVIEGIRRVIPCVVTYDTIPLFPPISDFYEKHLERELQMQLFQVKDGIYPLQFIDADFLESWESNFDLSPESGIPFGYLETRSRDRILRHRKIETEIVAASARPETPRPFEDLVQKSWHLLETEVRSWLSQPTLPQSPESSTQHG